MLKPGTLFSNRYRIDHKIGVGAGAAVYQAQDTQMGQPVALKVTSASHPGSPELTRARAEGKALAKLRHAGFVQVLDQGLADDTTYFLSMTLLQGPTLEEVLRVRPLTVQQALSIVIGLCDSLAHMEQAGLVHADVKASNIILCENSGQPVLYDLGLVAFVDDELQDRAPALGSVHTMAPEQVRGGNVTHQTDLYAIGVLLYRMICGRYPFHSKRKAAALAMHLNRPCPPFEDQNVMLMVPTELEPTVLKCLEKSPTERWQSAQELREVLRRCLREPQTDYISVATTANRVEERQRRRAEDATAPPESSLLPVLFGGGALIFVALIALWWLG